MPLKAAEEEQNPRLRTTLHWSHCHDTHHETDGTAASKDTTVERIDNTVAKIDNTVVRIDGTLVSHRGADLPLPAESSCTAEAGLIRFDQIDPCHQIDPWHQRPDLRRSSLQMQKILASL